MRTFLPIVLVLCSLLFFTTCAFDMWPYGFTFFNYSEHTIYVISDLESKDNCISVNDLYIMLGSGEYRFITCHDPLKEIVKDSIIFYVVDGERVILPHGSYLSQEDVDNITTDDILERITVYHNQVKDIDNFFISYGLNMVTEL